MHGGAEQSGGQPGNRNALKHGRYTVEAVAQRRCSGPAGIIGQHALIGLELPVLSTCDRAGQRMPFQKRPER